MRAALTTGNYTNPQVLSLLTRYTLAKELNISPKEQDELPFTLVRDLMTVHGVVESIKAEEIEKVSRDTKGKMNKLG